MGTLYHAIIRKLLNLTEGTETPNGKMQMYWNMDSYPATKYSRIEENFMKERYQKGTARSKYTLSLM